MSEPDDALRAVHREMLEGIQRWLDEGWVETKLRELLRGLGWSDSMFESLWNAVIEAADDEDEECE